MSKFNIRMRLTDARDYTYLYSNSSAFTVIGGICAVSGRMHAGIVLFQKRRNVCTRIYDLEQRILIWWRFALVRFGILSSVLTPSDESCRPLSQIRACTSWNRFLSMLR